MRKTRGEYWQKHKGRIDLKRRGRMVALKIMKGGECAICGYRACQAALQFHHVDPSTKAFNISQSMSRSMDDLEAEVSKCILLCANCHTEWHEKEWNG